MATPIPANRARFSLSEVASCVGGKLVGAPRDPASQLLGVSSDTRSVRPGELFVALAGPRFDGHDHLAAAAAAGCPLALVERALDAPAGMALLQVGSTLDALGALAASYIARWRQADARRKVVALTGSAGKTTTRKAICALLASLRPGAVHGSEGNLNNRIGVPMSVLALGDGHRYAVLELGTNTPGEIPRLGRMVRPDLGLITLIAAAHTEGFGDVEAVAREKAALFDELPPGAVALGSADDARVAAALMRCDATTRVTYGKTAGAHYQILRRAPRGADRAEVQLRRRSGPNGGAGAMVFETPLLGYAGALASAAAVAVVETLLGEPLDGELVSRGLRGVPVDGRLAPVELAGDVLLLDDSYNANPASFRSSLATAAELAEVGGRRLLVVAGEMRELGAQSLSAHEQLGREVALRGASVLIAVSGDCCRTAASARDEGVEAHFVDDSQAAAELAVQQVEPGDLVLVKGSRGVRTELVVEALRRSLAVRGRVAAARIGAREGVGR